MIIFCMTGIRRIPRTACTASRHPKTALGNAQRDYHLNWKEKNIIARHMFPLIPVPPQCREAWIVCLADKWCALGETVEPMFHVKHFK